MSPVNAQDPMYYPKDKGGERTAKSLGYESEGEPGVKADAGSPMASMAGEDGHHEVDALDAHAKKKGLPGTDKYPSNVTGVVETDEPTKGEGSTSGY